MLPAKPPRPLYALCVAASASASCPCPAARSLAQAFASSYCACRQNWDMLSRLCLRAWSALPSLLILSVLCVGLPQLTPHFCFGPLRLWLRPAPSFSACRQKSRQVARNTMNCLTRRVAPDKCKPSITPLPLYAMHDTALALAASLYPAAQALAHPLSFPAEICMLMI